MDEEDCVNEGRVRETLEKCPQSAPSSGEDEHRRIGGENSRGGSPEEWSVAEAG